MDVDPRWAAIDAAKVTQNVAAMTLISNKNPRVRVKQSIQKMSSFAISNAVISAEMKSYRFLEIDRTVDA